MSTNLLVSIYFKFDNDIFMKSILLVRTSAIGDVIQTLPVAEYLRQKFPEARIDWVVEKGIAPLLRQLKVFNADRPLIDTVIEIESRKWAKAPWLKQSRQCVRRLRDSEYDVLFDLQGNTKSALITLLARAKEKVGFGWKSVREKTNVLATSKRFELPLDLNIRQKYLQLVQSYLRDDLPFESKGFYFDLLPEESSRLNGMLQLPFMQKPPILMIAAGSKWKNKKLHDDALIALMRQAEESAEVRFLVIFGNEEEKAFAEKLLALFPHNAMAAGSLSLPLWQALMRHVDGIIAVDSAALHFAGTTQTPSFSVFGPTSAQIFKPIERQHYAYQGKCPYGRNFHKQCPILRTCPTGACIRALKGDELETLFSQWCGSLAKQDVQ